MIADNIFESLPMMTNVMLITFLAFLAFAVIGVYSFEGSLQDYCTSAEGLLHIFIILSVSKLLPHCLSRAFCLTVYLTPTVSLCVSQLLSHCLPHAY